MKRVGVGAKKEEAVVDKATAKKIEKLTKENEELKAKVGELTKENEELKAKK